MRYAVAESQVRNVQFKYTDLATADFSIEHGPVEDEDEAEAWNERELDGEGVVIEFADGYMEDYPTQ